MDAIAVAERERRDRRRSCSAPRETVAHTVPHTYLLDQRRLGLDRHCWPEVDFAVGRGVGMEPVDGDSAADHARVGLGSRIVAALLAACAIPGSTPSDLHARQYRANRSF